MGQARRGRFLLGFAWGCVLGFAVLLLPVLWLGTEVTVNLYAQLLPRLQRFRDLASLNLQGSVLPFAAILLAYCVQLGKLYKLLEARDPCLERVVRHEQLLDLCANLFFGTGVIWTSIGMRDALLHALGDPGATVSAGAFAILQRMVDGGILLALSTTIVGGTGGYLMRVVKSVTVGQMLTRLYMRATEQPSLENLEALRRIESLLHCVRAERDREPS